MNNGLVIFLGMLFVMISSWYGIVATNFNAVGRQEPVRLVTGEVYPGGRTGAAQLGQEVYQANGCASCHTMQVRVRNYGRDLERGWGARNSVLQDYLYDQHVFLGQTRIGPDLANIGNRNPDRTWQLLHLYNPRITVPESMMPQYPYLFQKRRIKGAPSPNALPVPEKFREEGYEIIPTREALALVEYLLSLRADTPLFEAPLNPKPEPPAQTDQTDPAGTNAPAAEPNQ